MTEGAHRSTETVTDIELTILVQSLQALGKGISINNKWILGALLELQDRRRVDREVSFEADL